MHSTNTVFYKHDWFVAFTSETSRSKITFIKFTPFHTE